MATNFEISFNRATQISPAPKWPLTSRLEDTQTCASNTSKDAANLSRRVYCVLGMPIDAISLKVAMQRVEAAATERQVFLISTPNLNFLVNSLSDEEFRASLLDSDLCPPDGTPIIWIARCLGLPIVERVAGADLLDQLQSRPSQTRPIRVFLFGGADGVAAKAAERLNRQSGGLTCVGTMNPGFGSISEMSEDQVIDAINTSDAEFLIVSLGAKKGQIWLRRNHDRLKIRIRSHLGAAINFQAGAVKRAPPIVSAWGFEWLWRIKEERYLWRRYRDDGFVFLRLLLTRVLPLAMLLRWQQFKLKIRPQKLLLKKKNSDHSILISMSGAAVENQTAKAASYFGEVFADRKDIVIDMSGTVLIDPRFLGLLLMLRKELKSCGLTLKLTAVPRPIRRMFRLNEAEFLLPAGC